MAIVASLNWKYCTRSGKSYVKQRPEWLRHSSLCLHPVSTLRNQEYITEFLCAMMMVEEGCVHDPMLSENLQSHQNCICCDKEICDFTFSLQESDEDKRNVDIQEDSTLCASYDHNLGTYYGEWHEFFKVLQSSDGIQNNYLSALSKNTLKEIFIKRTNAHLWDSSSGPRKPYQRFRNKRFVCDECSHSFTLKQNVQYHILTYHLGNQTIRSNHGRRFICLNCQKMFRDEQAAEQHHRRQHEQEPKTPIHRCTTCARIFSSKTQLKEHITIQHLLKCGARFGRQGGLRRHFVMVHTNRRYYCTYADCTHAGFKCSKALAAHIRSVHTKDRPFACYQCGKRFVRRNDQRVHERLHSTKRENSCKKCGQHFRGLVSRQAHERTCKVINNVGADAVSSEKCDTPSLNSTELLESLF
ncbi:unnamed protein product [Thelazia callipaeda]|uniref:Zinc finger protein n=1 Tax=Thelazia callipaeda TaxID=103827 RepID=A0A0N5DC38_THECL|nr:unnamed protein product [Thelazia callipaeda]